MASRCTVIFLINQEDKMKAIEKTIKHCNDCDTSTTHERNISKTSWLMIAIHLILIIITGGIWLAMIITWKVLTVKIGGWSCSECRKRGR